MVTKYKAAVFIIAAMFSSIVSAAYTTMTIEGVKEANGVWTAAGVIDNMGFIKSTGTLTVSGVTATTAVSLPVDKVAASTLLRSAGRLAGPASLALAAYDVYSWMTSDPNVKLENKNGNWYTVNDHLGYCNLPAPIYVNANNYAMSNCVAAAQNKYRDDLITVCPSGNTWYLRLNGCAGYGVGYFSPASTVSAPSVESDFNRLMAPTWSLISSGFSKIPSLLGQAPISAPKYGPFSSWLGDPYFKDGNWYRDRADVSPCPTSSQPTRVCVDIGPQKLDGQSDPNIVPSGGTATGSTSKEPTDFCKKNPMSIACSEMGELKDEKLEVEERPVDVSYTPWGSSTSQCPADKIIPLWEGQSISISYSPVCQFASLLRPLVIALAFVAAGFIVAGITRKGAES